MLLAGKTAIITGASRGIGKAIALTLAKAGANVAINFSSNEKAALDVANEAGKSGVKAFAIKADVTKSYEVENFVNTVLNEFGSKLY